MEMEMTTGAQIKAGGGRVNRENKGNLNPDLLAGGGDGAGGGGEGEGEGDLAPTRMRMSFCVWKKCIKQEWPEIE